MKTMKEILGSLNLEPKNLEETRKCLNLLQKIELAKFFLQNDVVVADNLKFADNEQEETEELIEEISYESKNRGYFKEKAEFDSTEDWLTDIYAYIDKSEYSESYSKVISSYN